MKPSCAQDFMGKAMKDCFDGTEEEKAHVSGFHVPGSTKADLSGIFARVVDHAEHDCFEVQDNIACGGTCVGMKEQSKKRFREFKFFCFGCCR